MKDMMMDDEMTGKADEQILMEILELARQLQGEELEGKKKPVAMKVEIESKGMGEAPAAIKEAMMGKGEEMEDEDEEEEMIPTDSERMLRKKGKIY